MRRKEEKATKLRLKRLLLAVLFTVSASVSAFATDITVTEKWIISPEVNSPQNQSGTLTVPFSTTPTFDAGRASMFRMVLTGNVTSSTVTNPSPGKLITFELLQDATGGRAFAWPANFIGAPALNSAPCIAPTTAINCTDASMTKASFYYDGANWRYLASLAGTASGQLLNPAALGGNIVIANAFPGTSLAGKINRADAALGAIAGEIWVLNGGAFISSGSATNLFDYDNLGYAVIHSGNTLRLGCGDYTSTAANNFAYLLPQSNTAIIGSGPCTKLHAPSGYNNPFIIRPYNSMLDGANADQNITVSNLQVVGQQVMQVNDLVVSAATLTATSATANFTASDEGKTLWIPGFNWAAIISVVNPTTLRLNSRPLTTGTVTARYVFYNSTSPHIDMGNCYNCSVTNLLVTKATSIAIQAGGNSNGMNASVMKAVALTTGTQSVTTGLTNPAAPVRLRIKGSAGGISGNVAIRGTGPTGEPATETIALNGTSAVDGTVVFSGVSSISLPARTNVGGTVSVGNAAHHATNTKLNDNICVNCVSQNIAIVNGINCEVKRNSFKDPGQIHGPGVSVVDLESNTANDVMINNEVSGNIIDATNSPAPLNTCISFSNGNLSANVNNRIVDNICLGQSNDTAGASNMNVGIHVISSSIHDAEISRNTITRADLNGLWLEGGARLRVTDNFCRGCGSAGSGAAMLLASGVSDSFFARNRLIRYKNTKGDFPYSDTSYINDFDPLNDRNIFEANHSDLLIIAERAPKIISHYLSDGTPTGTAPYVGTQTILAAFTPPAGTFGYVTDGSITNPCTGGGTGTLGRREGSVWNCAVPTLTGATPAVRGLTNAVFVNGGATTVTNLTGAIKGQLLTITGDANTTIQNNANIITRSRANIVPFNGLTNTFLFDGLVWRQVN